MMKMINTRKALLPLIIGLSLSPLAHSIDFKVADTDLKVGGYIKGMATFDSNGTVTAPYNGHLYSVYGTPIDGTANADTNHFNMTARESRVYLKTKTDSDIGTISSHVEGDFFADIDSDGPTWSNSHGFRIRHAYINIDREDSSILVGQTWTAFMDFASSLPSMDFSSDPGNSFIRQAQVRYQYNLSPGQYLMASLENPAYGMANIGGTPIRYVNLDTNGNGVHDARSEETLPDLVVKYFLAKGPVTISPRAVVRQFDLGGQKSTGYGFALGASVKFGQGHKAVLNYTIGDGIGRYAGLGFNAGAGIDNTGNIETLGYQSLTGGIMFALSPSIRWQVGAGYSEQDEDAFDSGTLTAMANKTAFSWHTNLYWDITKDLQFAVGTRFGDVENMGSAEGDMVRTQSYLRYTF
ncbi:hypothetical protein K0I73_15220 [Shewanella mesophila]|uniref:DcaP family trimeric outer membrane transporter n=1 Tax=Shewanella mesophila TaxID=2864208 RepID=UPI001C65B910|nr:DcaP family trimeric outer membrane transporter [Shewanella mesophila]QYJ85535.1 hypothetical protein K0I73_15220 [Shewanella mesophila]